MQAEDELPIASQLAECKKLAESRGWQIAKVYEDAGFTGRNTDRPALQELLSDVHKKRNTFDKLIVWKGNRLGRNTEDRLALNSLLARRGVAIVSVTEPEFEGSVKVLMVPIMAAIDEYQSHLIAEDTLRSMKLLASQGYSSGGNPPKGYRIKREAIGIKKSGQPRFRSTWEPDPEWRGKALQAFRMLADGKSTSDIIAETGVFKNKSSACVYFNNPTFIGCRVYNVHRRQNGRVVKVSLDDKDVIRIKGAHEAIIPVELFNRCQEILQKRRPQPQQLRATKHDFILSGLLYCERHNCSITGTGYHERRYYVCESLRRHGRKESDCPHLKKEALEKFVLGILKEHVFTLEHIRQAIQYLADTSKGESEQVKREVNNLRKQINTLKREIDNLTNAIAQDTAPRSVLEAISKREQHVSSLQKQLEDIQESAKKTSIANISVNEDFIKAIWHETIAMLDSESPEQLKSILRYYVEQIKISGNQVSIKFAFRQSSDSSQLMVAGAVLRYLDTTAHNLNNDIIARINKERCKTNE